MDCTVESDESESLHESELTQASAQDAPVMASAKAGDNDDKLEVRPKLAKKCSMDDESINWSLLIPEHNESPDNESQYFSNNDYDSDSSLSIVNDYSPENN